MRKLIFASDDNLESQKTGFMELLLEAMQTLGSESELFSSFTAVKRNDVEAFCSLFFEKCDDDFLKPMRPKHGKGFCHTATTTQKAITRFLKEDSDDAAGYKSIGFSLEKVKEVSVLCFKGFEVGNLRQLLGLYLLLCQPRNSQKIEQLLARIADGENLSLEQIQLPEDCSTDSYDDEVYNFIKNIPRPIRESDFLSEGLRALVLLVEKQKKSLQIESAPKTEGGPTEAEMVRTAARAELVTVMAKYNLKRTDLINADLVREIIYSSNRAPAIESIGNFFYKLGIPAPIYSSPEFRRFLLAGLDSIKRIYSRESPYEELLVEFIHAARGAQEETAEAHKVVD